MVRAGWSGPIFEKKYASVFKTKAFQISGLEEAVS
jgi:hypothetical protein